MLSLGTISGTAPSDTSNVKVSIYNQTALAYWDGTVWNDAISEDASWLTGSGQANWTFTSPAYSPANWYKIKSKALIWQIILKQLELEIHSYLII